MKFLGCNIDEIRTDLLQDMSIDIIPTIYGGKNNIWFIYYYII